MCDGGVLKPGEGQVVPLPGATMVFKAGSDRTTGDYVVGEFTAEPGFGGPKPHVHRTHEELFYVLDGEFEFYVGDHVERLGPGSFVNVPPGTIHDFRNAGTLPARFLGIVAPRGFDRYFQEVRALAAAGTLTDEALRELRVKYDTHEVADVPDGHWSARN
jgi:mannose-6-phosphate isomerase-like protein (cupin superfamily)